MANKNPNQLAVVALLMFLVLTSQPSSSRGRLLNADSLAVSGDRFLAEKAAREKEAEIIGHVSASPSDHQPHHRMVFPGKLPSLGTTISDWKYGSLILNMLPKGAVPPSAPSIGIHSVNN